MPALGMLVWLPVFIGELTLVSAFIPRDWHVHEMLYGYLPAVVTGFLFTAIPNWTGRLPLRGRPLMLLVALWIAGRACVTFSAETGWLAAMLVDCSFLLLIAAAAAREIMAGKKWKNLGVVALILRPARRQRRIPSRGAFQRRRRIRHSRRHRSRRAADLVDRRAYHSELHTQLAGASENPGRLPVPFARFDMLSVAVGAAGAGLLDYRSPAALRTGCALALAGVMH